MTTALRNWLPLGLLCSMLVLPALLMSAERRSGTSAAQAAPPVNMFDAMASKDIEVRLIPKDDKESRVMIRNNTGKPLTVKLPDAFAGMPVLAQRAGGLGGGGGAAGGRGGVGGQSVGGGMGGGMMGGGMGMGMMNVPAEKVAQVKVPTVCLEHGKKVPHAHMQYEIHPIEDFSTKPELKTLLTNFGREGGDQRATQAAAWHLSNDMTWEELAAKQIEHLDGSSEIWFSPDEIRAGMAISQKAKVDAEELKQKKPGKSKPTSKSPKKRSAQDDEAKQIEIPLDADGKPAESATYPTDEAAR